MKRQFVEVKNNKEVITPKVHELKIKPCYFDAVAYYGKRFEIRKNDRDFKPGDFILLRPWDEDQQRYFETGEYVFARITYILDDPEYNMPGYVTFSFVVMEEETELPF